MARKPIQAASRPPALIDRWTSIFTFPGWSDGHAAGMMATMNVRPSDIFNGKLTQARTFFKGVETGNLSILRSVPRSFSFMDALSVLAIIGTHSRISRLPGVRFSGRGGWIRMSDNTDLPRRFPVMPLSDISRISGLGDSALMAILSPFTRDGALRLVPDIGGEVGVVLQDGYINDEAVKRFFVQ